ncbi:MAG: hypothetical protein IJY82_07655 [Oscillospiraceae bacterium]|nr:hypothetical protein [Oscillospiraceae bacterium]
MRHQRVRLFFAAFSITLLIFAVPIAFWVAQENICASGFGAEEPIFEASALDGVWKIHLLGIELELPLFTDSPSFLWLKKAEAFAPPLLRLIRFLFFLLLSFGRQVIG